MSHVPSGSSTLTALPSHSGAHGGHGNSSNRNSNSDRNCHKNDNPLYSAASRIPLIKSPSVSVPPPVRLPSDLHPLPPDISAYFVYPFSLESYVLDPNTPSSRTVEELQTRYSEYLKRREEEREQEKRDLLRRMAPGWAEGGGGVMIPDLTKAKKGGDGEGEGEGEGEGAEVKSQKEERAPIDDLVDHLAMLEAMGAKPVGDPTGRP